MSRAPSKPKASRPTAVSVFTGAGGLDIGLERAGFETVVATDVDSACVATLRASQAACIPVPEHPDRAFLEGAEIIEASVQELRPRDLRPAGVVEHWRPDVLVGGPPCQPFSAAGKMRSTDDERGMLFEHFVRIARGLRPHTILFENVQGLVTARGPSGRPGEVLVMVKEAFEQIGYATTFSLLNAADYGAPQRRTRCFMLASRVEPLPVFPAPTHGRDAAPSLLDDRRPWVSLRAFLETLPPPDERDVVRPSDQLARELGTLPAGSGLKSRGAREATRPGGHWGYRQGMWIADPDLPARTVTAATSQDWLRSADGGLRRLTWRECAGLQGFPAAWQFQGPAASRFRQVGNAVPAVFGQVLGAALIDALSGSQRRRARSAPLPERFVAAMDYTEREHARNGESRRLARMKLAAGADIEDVKGLGADDVSELAQAS